MSKSAGLGFLMDVKGFESVGGVVKLFFRQVVHQCNAKYLAWIGEGRWWAIWGAMVREEGMSWLIGMLNTVSI